MFLLAVRGFDAALSISVTWRLCGCSRQGRVHLLTNSFVLGCSAEVCTGHLHPRQGPLSTCTCVAAGCCPCRRTTVRRRMCGLWGSSCTYCCAADHLSTMSRCAHRCLGAHLLRCYGSNRCSVATASFAQRWIVLSSASGVDSCAVVLQDEDIFRAIMDHGKPDFSRYTWDKISQPAKVRH